MDWYRFDLHVHTPASECYRQAEVSYLDILRKAEEKRLDILAIADHNTVRGYAELLSEIRDLELLESLDRLQGPERDHLQEYRRLMRKILVLPGVEFTATFGFHILGIFSRETTVRDLEHLLLNMGVPSARLDEGTGEVGATVDVLTAYRMLREAGGIVIAAHANSTHGVALQGLNFGGQTKIAFTQDRNLHALEVTDLESGRRHRTAEFFDGSRPEYPRRMHIVQGSDAHRLDDDPTDRSQFGVGGRAMEVLLPEVSFEALKQVFESEDFARMRPYRAAREPFDYVQAAREAGPSIVQSFHESMSRRGGRLHAILRDVVAFANTNGGTTYVGVSGRPSAPVKGVDRVEEAMATLKADIQRRITPSLEVAITPMKTKGKTVLRVSVPNGPSKPYTLEGSKIYVRQETETSLAVRDEIVQIISRQSGEAQGGDDSGNGSGAREAASFRVAPPRTGVEVVSTEERKGIRYHALRDLRNRSVVRDVTKESARRLWRYAIKEHEKASRQQPPVKWEGDLGLWKSYKRGNRTKYNLTQLDESGATHYYYGVTEEGLHGEWKGLVGSNGASPAEETAPVE
ncbi:MAG: transcriptional regulator [Anaerolineae bacterium]|nr:transcriptional regulator [Anaerolineae bacterium]